MNQKYPVGIQDFEKLRSENYVYVDKTKFVWEIAKWGGYFFLSRPRRFGKSMLISTLEALYKGKKPCLQGSLRPISWQRKTQKSSSHGSMQ